MTVVLVHGPVAVLPGRASPAGQRSSADTLLTVVADAVELSPAPEPVGPEFAPYPASFADSVPA